MLFRFDNFCERWAQVYEPLSHIPSADGRRCSFLRHDTLDDKMEIAKRLVDQNNNRDCFMSVITSFDGELVRMSENSPKPNYYQWRRHVLFWVRETQGSFDTLPQMELSAADAKARGVEMAADFIAFIDLMQDKKRGNMPDLQGVDLDSIEIVTLPRAFNGWWITVINFDQMEGREKCTADAKYDINIISQIFPMFNKAVSLQNSK